MQYLLLIECVRYTERFRYKLPINNSVAFLSQNRRVPINLCDINAYSLQAVVLISPSSPDIERRGRG